MGIHNRRIGQDMLVAVNNLVLENGDPKELTTEFWQAFGPFTAEYLTGVSNVEISSDGRVVASFHPKK